MYSISLLESCLHWSQVLHQEVQCQRMDQKILKKNRFTPAKPWRNAVKITPTFTKNLVWAGIDINIQINESRNPDSVSSTGAAIKNNEIKT